MNAQQLNAAAREVAGTIKTEPLGSLNYTKAATAGFEATGNPQGDYMVFWQMIQRNVAHIRQMENLVANQTREMTAVESQKLPSEIEEEKAAKAAAKGGE